LCCEQANLKLAKEVSANHQEHGEKFDKAFKESIEQEMVSSSKTGKRKRNYIDTYNDLNEGEQIMLKDGEESDEEDWVRKNVFTV
jgi:hypothetical protein